MIVSANKCLIRGRESDRQFDRLPCACAALSD